MIFTNIGKKLAALIAVICLVVGILGGWLYSRHQDTQKAKIVTPEEIHNTQTLEKKLNVDKTTAHDIQDSVARVTVPTISYTITAPTIQKAAEQTAKDISSESPSLPAAATEKTDRTMVVPNDTKQTVDVYKINLRKPHKIKAGVLATSDHVYYGAGYQAGRWEGMLYTRTGRKIEAGTITYTLKEW